jgi:hypothetical protein
MKLRRLLVLWVASFSVGGCGEPRLDATSQDNFKSSVEKVRSALPDSDREVFDSAYQFLALSGINPLQVLSGKSSDQLINESIAQFSGKTGREVIAMAEKLRVEQAAKQRAQALQEISELRAQLVVAEQAEKELAAFQVTRSRFSKLKGAYDYTARPILEIDVTNNTKYAISRAFFRGTIASPGRSVPWLVEEFNHEIAGGLEPGESAKWRLAPNPFSEWGKIDPPIDAVFTVKVVRLNGPDDKPLYDAEGLSDEKLTRLSELEKRYAQ